MIEKIIDQLFHLKGETLVKLYNVYCDANGLDAKAVYENNEDTINGMFDSPFDALRQIDSRYNSYDLYFVINRFGDFVSFSDPYHYIDSVGLANWLDEHQDVAEKYGIVIEVEEDEAEEEDEV